MKKMVLVLGLLTLGGLSLYAQTGKTSRVVHAKEASTVHVPPQEVPAALRVLYSNLGTQTDLYLDTTAWSLTGFNSYGGSTSAFSIGLPFTPKFNSHVAQVRVAVQYYGSGANQVNLSIYGDAGGAPGALLTGPVTVKNLPPSGSCCVVTIANFKPLAVTSGTRYWVVASAPVNGIGSDFVGGWNWVSKIILFGGSNGVNPWAGTNTDGLPAGEVLGTVP